MEKVKTEKRMIGKYQRAPILNRDVLKILAAAAMLIDHIGWRFFAFVSPEAQACHVLGRVALTIMCLFLTEGYFHTRSKKRYALRLFLFALLSQLPYTMFQGIHWSALDFNVMFTLLFCFLSICFYESIPNEMLRWMAVFGCMMAAWWCDWGVTAVLYTLALWIFREDRGKKVAAFSAVSVFYFCSNFLVVLGAGAGFVPSLLSCLYMLGVFLALVPILLYSGEKGRFLEGAIGKWFFYLFYPVHLFLLALI